MKIKRNYSLKLHNTFGIDVKADYYVSVASSYELAELLESRLFKNNKCQILGGGSNILFIEDFKGLVIDINIKGIKYAEVTKEHVTIEAGAGELWHDFVSTCLLNKFYGLENLALIPGKIGAAPVQNIGAYGVEQKDFFVSLEGFDLTTHQKKIMLADECRFSYRDSVFKNNLRDKFIITSVNYKLKKQEEPNISYKELAEEFARYPDLKPGATDIFDTVIRLRTKKMPIAGKLGNAGSFFKNPIVTKKKYDYMLSKETDFPGYVTDDGMVKIPAAWLIERSGWKGQRIGDAGVFDNHALILVNHGNATGEQILTLAENIKKSVMDNFGISLEFEVNIV